MNQLTVAIPNAELQRYNVRTQWNPTKFEFQFKPMTQNQPISG